MKECFKLLKDTISLTKKSLKSVANDSSSENASLVSSCIDTLGADLIFIDAFEQQVQKHLTERNELLTFINNKGLLNEFYGEMKRKGRY